MTGIDILLVGSSQHSTHIYRDILLRFVSWSSGPLPICLRQRIWAIIPALTFDGLGYLACKRLRENPLYENAYISLLAPKSSPEVASVLSRYGADDVMVGEFSIAAVERQIDLILSKNILGFERTLSCGYYKLDLFSYKASWNEKEIYVNRSHLFLFRFFMNHPGLLFSTNDLISATGEIDNLSCGAMQRIISRLRSTFRSAGVPDPIKAVRSFGYRLEV